MSTETFTCVYCGEPFYVNPDWTTNHAGPAIGETGLDPFDLDEDHVAFGYTPCCFCGAETDVRAGDAGENEDGETLGVVCDYCRDRMHDEEIEALHQADLDEERYGA